MSLSLQVLFLTRPATQIGARAEILSSFAREGRCPQMCTNWLYVVGELLVHREQNPSHSKAGVKRSVFSPAAAVRGSGSAVGAGASTLQLGAAAHPGQASAGQ